MFKFRLHEWADKEEPGKTHWGLQCRRKPTESWVHCVTRVDGENQVILYPNKERALEVLKMVRARAEENQE